ncbi:hypothetical protein [Neolewinella maritima]|uniref:hypothetical protein n=1 Tax=Neolewinella maritima TaxID=1383882 RepID=UPI001EE8EFA7|nr:hypothetical protein [Neolewinella maritima]
MKINNLLVSILLVTTSVASCGLGSDEAILLDAQSYRSDTVSIVDPESYYHMWVIEKRSKLLDDGIEVQYRDTLEDGTERGFGKHEGSTYQLYEVTLVIASEDN